MGVELLAGNIAAHWVQAGALATSALIAMKLLHLNEPRARLAALHVTLVAVMLLPLVQPWRSDEPALQVTPAAIAIDVAAIASEAAVVSAGGAEPWLDRALAIVVIAAVGTALRLMWLVYGIIRLARFSRRATDVAPPPTAAALEVEIGVSPRYILQTGNRGPWTFGLFRPTVALPSRFEALTADFQRAVICHELLHIKRRDIAVALVEELALATLWFHPWVWLLRARIRVAREQVVDARVVELLGNRDGYVRCLVDISGHDLAPHFSQAGAGMLRPCELRARVDAIFQETRMSRRHLVFVTLALMMAVGSTTYVAAAALPMRSPAIVDRASSITAPQAMVQDPGMPAPTMLDPATNGPIRLQFRDARLRDVLAFIGRATSVVFTGYEASFDEGRSVTIDTTAELEPLLDSLLTPSGLMYTVTGPRTVVIARRPPAEKSQLPRRQINKAYPEYPQDALERGIKGVVIVDITVNAAGDVSTAAVASGPQELRASAFKAALGLKYTPGASTIPMRISVEYALTGNSWGVRIGETGTNGNRSSGTTGSPPVVSSRGPADQMPAALRVGGDVRPPKKIKDMPPVYPPIAQGARVQGVVIMEVRIDESGNVSDTRVLRSIPLLDEAAIDAVKQWQYTPTWMNGVAVPVLMTVTVNFTLRDVLSVRLIEPGGQVVDMKLRPGEDAGINHKLFGWVHFKIRRSGPDAADLSVYGADNETHLGTVTLVIGGPVMQSPTTPSFGIQLLGFD